MKNPTIKSILARVTDGGTITPVMVDIAHEFGTLHHCERRHFWFIWVERHVAGWEHRAFGIFYDVGKRRAYEDNSLWLELPRAA